MASFISVPQQVEAVQYTGSNFDQIRDFVGSESFNSSEEGVFIWIGVNHIWAPIEIGEWVLAGAQGFWILKDAVFQVTYLPGTAWPSV